MWWRRVLWALLAIVALCLLAAAFLPRVVSSPWARGRIETLLSASVARPVRLGAVRLTWSGELSIERFEIADAPQFSPAPLLALNRLRVQVDPLRLLRRRLDLEVALDGLEVRLIRSADGRTNLGAFLAGLPPRKPRAAGPLALPVEEARVRVRITGVSVFAEDRGRGRSAAVRNASVSLDAPGLWEPARAELHADLTVDGRTLPPLQFRGRVEKLIRPDRTLNLGGAIADADGSFPGGTLSLHVDLGKPVARGRLEVDLAALADAARPFAPSLLAETDVGGRFALSLAGAPRPDGALAFSLRAAGSKLTASGGPLGGRAVGPVAFDVENTGTLDRARGALSVEKGELRLQQRSHAAWTLTATELNSATPQMAATAKNVLLDLRELEPMATPFLPRGVALGAGDRAHPASLTLALATVSGPLSGATNPVAVDGLALSLPRLAVKRGTIALSARDVAVSVDHLRGTLTRFFPERLAIQAGFRCKRLDVAAPRRLSAEGIDASVARLELADLARASGLFPITLRGSIRHVASVRRLDVPRVAEVREYRQSGEAEFSIGSGDLVSLSLPQVGLSAVAVRVDGGAGTSVQLDRSSTLPGLGIEVTGFRFSGRFPAGPNPVEIPRATLVFARVRAKTATRSATAERVELALHPLTAVLRHRFPERLDLRASAKVGAVELGGARPAAVRDLRVTALEVAISDLRKDASALLGVTARIRLAESLAAAEATVPALGRIAGLTESARIAGELQPGGQARLAVESFGLDVARARAVLPGVAPVETAARVGGRVERVSVRGLAPSQIDVDGLRASVTAGDILAADLEASARGLGAESIASRGDARLDLAEVSRLIPEERLRGGRLSGTAKVRWALDGRLPGAAKAAREEAPAGLIKSAGLDSMRQAVITVNLAEVGASLAFPGGARVVFAGLSTPAPIEARVQNGRLAVAAKLEAERIEALPGLGALREPLAAGIHVQGEQTGPGSVRLSESLAVERLGLSQKMQVTLTGLDRLVDRGLGSPVPLWLTILGGDLHASIALADVGGLGLASESLALRGRLTAGLDLRLARGEELALGAWLKAADAEAGLAGRIEVNGAHADIAIEKRYRLVRVAKTGAPPPAAGWLSEEVLNGRAGARLPPAGARGPVRFDAGSSMRLALVRSHIAPLAVEAQHVGAALSLPRGLPVVDRFQADLLGGSVVGSFAVLPPTRLDTGRGLSVRLLAAFTGLDAARLVPGAPPGGEDAELSGRLALALPLGIRIESILAGMRLEADLSHIGPRTLDRALYALDPSESNETIMKQRKLLRLGRPRRVTLGLKNGNLSVSGLVEAAGVQLDLPRVERVNVAGVAGLRRFDARLAGLRPLLDLLHMAAADVLEIDDTGRVAFRKGDDR